MEIAQKKKRELVGFYLYCLQGLLLSILSFALFETLFDSQHESAYKLYKLLSYSLYIPLIILVLYSFKSIVKVRNKLFVKNIVAFAVFGALLFFAGKIGIIEYDTLFFFLVPIFLYTYNKVVLRKFIRGYSLLRFLFHYGVLFLSFSITMVVMVPVLEDSGKTTYVKNFYIADVYIKNDAEIYISNPALIFLVAMIVFISAHRIKKTPKERALLFLFAIVLYIALYYGFIQFINHL